MRISVLCLLPLAGLLEATLIPRVVGASHSVAAHLVVTANGGFNIPEGPDGRFSITYDPEGNSTEAIITTLELFDKPTVISKRSHGELAKRNLPITSWGCVPSWHNRDSYDQATIMFGIGCDHLEHIPAAPHPAHSGLLYVRVGSSIAYGCSYAGISPCSSGEFNDFNAFATEQCGLYGSGWVWMDEWCKGYGRILSGEEACGHSNLH